MTVTPSTNELVDDLIFGVFGNTADFSGLTRFQKALRLPAGNDAILPGQ